MKAPGKWIESSDKGPYVPVKKSGRAENVQLKGYDARDRVTTKSNGALVTSDFLKRNPSRIQQKQEWKAPEGFINPVQKKPDAPVEVKKWHKKGYDLTAPAVSSSTTRAGMHSTWEKKTPVHSVEQYDYAAKGKK